MGYDAFMRDRKTQDAVVRNLEIIGVTAGCLPELILTGAEAVGWRKIVGMRNILAYEYFGVSLPIVWDIVQNTLSPLDTACRKLLESDSTHSKEQE